MTDASVKRRFVAISPESDFHKISHNNTNSNNDPVKCHKFQTLKIQNGG